MGHFTFGSGGGHSLVPVKGTKVVLAGKPAILPNIEVPFVMQTLTKRQIDAIPKTQFTVSIIDKIEVPNMSSVLSHRGGGAASLRNRLKRQPNLGGKIGSRRFGVRSLPVRPLVAEADGTKQYMTLVGLLDDLSEQANHLITENRRLSRNYDGDPPDSNLFYEPINERLMSDCIMKVIADFFGSDDKCKIYGHEYKLVEFCLLMHYYFLRIGIMQNTARKPFAEYILRNVLKDETKFAVKTFNNYANDYKNDEKDFIDGDGLDIDFRLHPDTSTRPHLDAFHEIGHSFYISKYFKDLRNIRKQMNKFCF